jgi:hypothetical protein
MKGHGKAAAETIQKHAATAQGPLFTLLGLLLFLVVNWAYNGALSSGTSNNVSVNTKKVIRLSVANVNVNTPTAATQDCPVQFTTEPTYSNLKGFCSVFPANKTASYLWNESLERILEGTLDKKLDDKADKEWMQDAANVLRPNRLRNGLRTVAKSKIATRSYCYFWWIYCKGRRLLCVAILSPRARIGLARLRVAQQIAAPSRSSRRKGGGASDHRGEFPSND